MTNFLLFYPKKGFPSILSAFTMIKSCIFVYTIMWFSYRAINFQQLNFPHPCWFLGSPISSQLSLNIIFISTLESSGSFSSASAIAPDTSGVDMDVPLFMLYRFPAPGVHAIICRPGATRSGLHTHSNVGPRPDTARFPESISLDPTVMIFLLHPGAVTLPGFGP